MMKRYRRSGNGNSLRLGALMLSALSATLLAGCGGSGSSKAVSKTPTKATKQHVQTANLLALRNMALSGVPNGVIFAMRGGATPPVATGVAGGAASGGTVSTTAATSSVALLPQTGQFLQNVAATSISNRTKAIRAMQLQGRASTMVTRDSGTGSSPGSPGNVPVDPPVPVATFYFDYYLGLWVDLVPTTNSTTFNLYVDQAKTQPAGSIVTTWPTGNTYPLIYASSYNYTAGNEAGSSGSYNNTDNQDGSGSSSYQDTYSDGSKDSGSSFWTGTGTYTWTGRTDNADKSYSSMSGTFHSDGSGGTHMQDSAGYTADFTYNADGSGHATITGPDPGLPATMVWDAMGNTTITYADGTSDYIPGWGLGIAVPVSSSSGGTGTAVGSSSGATPPSAPGKSAIKGR